jgi:AAA domain-containing protein
MMISIIAIANQKGGVGKTTTAVNLSGCQAKSGRRVLVVDLDSQANCTSHFGVDPETQRRNAYHVLVEPDSDLRAVSSTYDPMWISFRLARSRHSRPAVGWSGQSRPKAESGCKRSDKCKQRRHCRDAEGRRAIDQDGVVGCLNRPRMLVQSKHAVCMTERNTEHSANHLFGPQGPNLQDRLQARHHRSPLGDFARASPFCYDLVVNTPKIFVRTYTSCATTARWWVRSRL